MNKERMTKEVIEEVKLPSIKKLVLLAIVHNVDEQGIEADPSVARIGEIAGVSGRHVTSMLKELRDSGIIEVVEEATYRTPTKYRIRLDVAPRFGVGEVAAL